MAFLFSCLSEKKLDVSAITFIGHKYWASFTYSIIGYPKKKDKKMHIYMDNGHA